MPQMQFAFCRKNDGASWPQSGGCAAHAPWRRSRFRLDSRAVRPEVPKPVIPELLPPDVERIYLQAERNFPVAGNEEAAGTMYGKALDISLKKIDPALTGMLGQKIKKLSAAGKLTADIAIWSENIRDIRNDAAHEEDPVTRDELVALRNFSEMVLRYLFSLPNAVRKRRGEKLEWEP